MINTGDMRNLPWHAMQRQLALGGNTGTSGYPTARSAPQPHWRFATGVGSWLTKARSGVFRDRPPL